MFIILLKVWKYHRFNSFISTQTAWLSLLAHLYCHNMSNLVFIHIVNLERTRMHSSRMCTAHSFTVSHSIRWGGSAQHSQMQTPPWMQPPLWCRPPSPECRPPPDVDPPDADPPDADPPQCRPPQAEPPWMQNPLWRQTCPCEQNVTQV